MNEGSAEEYDPYDPFGPFNLNDFKKWMGSQHDSKSKSHMIGLEVESEVVLNSNFGVFVKLEDEVEALVYSSEIDKEKGKIKVSVNMFGRETPANIDFLQAKKV